MDDEPWQQRTPAEWAQRCAQDQWHQDAITQAGIRALQRLLEGESPPEDIAREVVDLYDAEVRADPRGNGYGCRFWGLVCDCVRQFGGAVERTRLLVDFMVAISAQADVEGTRFSQGIYWRDLPEFGWNFRELALNDLFSEMFYCREEYFPPDGRITGDWYPVIQRYLNAITFAAIFLSASDRAGFSWFAKLVLGDAHDVFISTTDEEERYRIRSANVLAAATWIDVGGAGVYSKCCRGQDENLTLERWAGWKERFGVLAVEPNLDARSRAAAARAFNHMISLDGVGA